MITIIDLENGEQRFTRRFPGILWAVDWSPDHRFIIVSYRGGAEIWNVRAEPPASVFKTNAHGGGDVKDAHFSADGKRAVTLGSDNKIRVWDMADLESEPPGFPPGGPEEVWRHLQQVLNLTLDENDEVVPLGSEGPSELAGWDPSLSERFAADQPGDASVRK